MKTEYFKLNELHKPRFCLRFFRLFPQFLAIKYLNRILQKKLINLKDCSIKPGFYCVSENNLYATKSQLNDTVFINYSKVKIGKNVKFSGGNVLLTSTHDEKNFNIIKSKQIIIKDNVWITRNCIILGGVTIGKNSIIAAGSVVSKDVPPNVTVAGNPSRIIKTF